MSKIEIKIHCKYDELINPKKLKNHPKNRNKHGSDQIERLAKIYEYQGIRHPTIVSTRSGFIVAGHGRKAAAIRAGAEKVPVVYQNFDSDEQEYAFLTSDNAIALWADLDLSGINADLADLGPDFDLDMLGIHDFKLDPPESEDEQNDDVTPEPPAKPKSKLGEVYQLGAHRLMCGYSTVIDHLNKLMEGERADMVFTDPPYNVNYDPESRVSSFSEKRKKNPLGIIKNDKKGPEAFRAFLDAVYTCLDAALKPGAPIYICHADTEGHHFRNAFVAQPWKMQSCLIWKKTVLCFGRADYQWIHEPILYGWKEGEKHTWHGDRKQTTVFEFPTDHYNKKESDTDGYVHPTQKPVNLIKYALNNSSLKGDIVVDLFGGSGSTLIACERTGRQARLMELDPKYVDVIIKRWEALTGGKAELVNG